jgi:hypothetical protein
MNDTSHREHIAAYRQALNEWVAAGNITLNSSMHLLVAHAEQHGLFLNPHRETANLWGFGTVQPLFLEADGGFWVTLEDLIVPTGLSYEDLERVFLADEASEERGDISVAHLPVGGGLSTRIVRHDFVLRAFSLHSPWRNEFYEKTKELMSHAMVKSGLAELFVTSSNSGFAVLAHMRATDGQVVRIQMMIHSFDSDNVPIVAAPWDDAAEDELVRIDTLCESYEVLRAGDAVEELLGPKVGESEARAIAMRPFDPTAMGGAS